MSDAALRTAENAPARPVGLPRERPDWVAHAVLILGIVLFALPVWIVVVGSTYDAASIGRGEVPLIPRADMSTYAEIWDDGSGRQGATPVWRMLLNSGLMALLIMAGKIAVSILSAFAIAFFRFPGRMLFFWLIFLTLMLPVEVRIIPTYEVMAGLHLINSMTGLTLPLIASATATLLFRQVFLAIPDELVEAARVDGAGPLRFLRDILIPVSSTNIAALAVILFVYGWNQYLWPLLVASDPQLDTIVIGIVKMIGSEAQTDWNRVMATTVLALIPPVAIVLLMQRWFVKGLTEGEK